MKPERKGNVIILGGKSDIAKALAKIYTANGYDLILAGRNITEIEAYKEELTQQYKSVVKLVAFDVLDFTTHEQFFEQFDIKITGVICCVGYLGDQKVAENDQNEALQILNSNYVGCVQILNKAANYLERQGSGFIIGISSVAGDRGRKSNYFYGSAKAGFTAYLSGLRARLAANKIHVLTVKPGFVATKMTAHLELPGKLTASAGQVAQQIYKAQQKNKSIVYVKSIWRLIMFVIKSIPETIFKKMNL